MVLRIESLGFVTVGPLEGRGSHEAQDLCPTGGMRPFGNHGRKTRLEDKQRGGRYGGGDGIGQAQELSTPTRGRKQKRNSALASGTRI